MMMMNEWVRRGFYFNALYLLGMNECSGFSFYFFYEITKMGRFTLPHTSSLSSSTSFSSFASKTRGIN